MISWEFKAILRGHWWKKDTATTTQNYSAQLHSKVREIKVSDEKEKIRKNISNKHFLVLIPQGQAARWKMEK